MGVFKRGDSWYIDLRYPGGRHRESLGRTTKRMAEKALKVTQGSILQGRFLMTERKEIRFDEFAKQYLDYAKTDKTSWATDEHRLKPLVKFFGDRRLDDITALYIESYKEERRKAVQKETVDREGNKKISVKVVKKATVNRELSLLRRMFNLAIKWKKATTNPMRDVRLFREDKVPKRLLSQEEITKVLGACTEYSRPIVLTAFHTGMRMGEILGLKWGQVDLGRRVITVLNPKEGKTRQIPINDTLLETLKALKGKATSDSVFVCGRTGRPAHVFRTAWRNVISKAGIPHVRFHDLRHNFATQLLDSGKDPETVRELLGHSSLLMVGQYVHTAPERKVKAVAALDVLLAPQAAESGPILVPKENLAI